MQTTGSVDSGLDKNGLGLDVGIGGHSRDSSGPGRSANATPVGRTVNRRPNGNGGPGNPSLKRSRPDDDDLEAGDEEEVVEPKTSKKIASKKTVVQTPAIIDGEADMDGDQGDPEQDMTPYCLCQRQSYGEMIGCDNDDCEFEWVSSPFPHCASS